MYSPPWAQTNSRSLDTLLSQTPESDEAGRGAERATEERDKHLSEQLVRMEIMLEPLPAHPSRPYNDDSACCYYEEERDGGDGARE